MQVLVRFGEMMRSRFLLGLLSLAVITAIGQTASAKPVSSTDARHWRADLYYMANAITRYHRNAFHSVSKGTFDRAVADLSARIPSLTRSQIIVGLKRIVAMIGDEHTGFGLSTGPPIFFHTLPIKFYRSIATAISCNPLPLATVRLLGVASSESRTSQLKKRWRGYFTSPMHRTRGRFSQRFSSRCEARYCTL